ncbi:hypothetical protein GGI10_005528, partial [Coemansia sp. RSA 2530]
TLADIRADEEAEDEEGANPATAAVVDRDQVVDVEWEEDRVVDVDEDLATASTAARIPPTAPTQRQAADEIPRQTEMAMGEALVTATSKAQSPGT